MQHEQIVLRIPPHPQYVSVVRQTIIGMAQQIDMTTQEISDLVLAVGEACNNAVRHGQPDCNYPVQVRCTIDPQALQIEIKNRYCGAAPSCPIGDAPIPEAYREGGMGVFLMKTLVDKVDIRWGKTDATVRLTKKLNGKGVAQAA